MYSISHAVFKADWLRCLFSSGFVPTYCRGASAYQNVTVLKRNGTVFSSLVALRHRIGSAHYGRSLPYLKRHDDGMFTGFVFVWIVMIQNCFIATCFQYTLQYTITSDATTRNWSSHLWVPLWGLVYILYLEMASYYVIYIFHHQCKNTGTLLMYSMYIRKQRFSTYTYKFSEKMVST